LLITIYQFRRFSREGFMLRCCLLFCLLVIVSLVTGAPAFAADGDETPAEPSQPSTVVEVKPGAVDAKIDARIKKILDATEWYENVKVVTDEGVVFLIGTAEDDTARTRAAEIAGRVEGVVTVINKMSVRKRDIWDLQPAIDGVSSMTQTVVSNLPFIGLAVIVLIVAWLLSKVAVSISSRAIGRYVSNQLLSSVMSRVAGIAVLLLGVYLTLQLTGMTGLAMTVVGGAGVFGLAMGFAFRDIAENFLASLLISLQSPFHMGDLIEVNGHKGYVQNVSMRGTLLMTFEGAFIQIPNSIIFKSVILNYTANKNTRGDFKIGIGYDDSITTAQEVVIKALEEHPAVLQDPAPSVLVEALGSSSINMAAYFWVNSEEHSWVKVRSALIRIVKQSLFEAGVTIPDDAREVIFPAGVPVKMLEAGAPEQPPKLRGGDAKDRQTTSGAEGSLDSEAAEIQAQAEQSRQVEGEGLTETGEKPQ